MFNYIINDSLEELSKKLLQDEILSNQFIEYIFLPGGNSILPLYEELEKQIDKLQNKLFFLTDERLVDIDTGASNEGQIAKYFPLLYKKFVGFNHHDFLEIIKKTTPENRLIIVGVGEDGHFASLFPTDKFFLDNELIHHYNKPDEFQRISVSYTFISSTKRKIVWLNGEKKAKIATFFINNNEEIPFVKFTKNSPEKINFYTDDLFYYAFTKKINATI